MTWGDTREEEESFREGKCPKCGSSDIKESSGLFSKTYECRRCGHNLTSA